MNQTEAIQMLTTAIRARTPVIAIETPEELRVLKAIRQMAEEPTTNVAGEILVERRLVFRWTCTEGTVSVNVQDDQLFDFGPPEFEATPAPHEALADYTDWAAGLDVDISSDDPGRRNRAIDERASILVMLDIHRFISDTEHGGKGDLSSMRAVRDAFAALRKTKSCLVLIAPSMGQLGDADRDILKMTWPLPSVAELAGMVKGAAKRVKGRVDVSLNGDTEVLARALAALTWTEAARTLSMAIVQKEALSVEACADLILSIKSDILRKQRGLELIQPDDGLDDIAGLDLLKADMAGLPKLLTEEAKRLKVRPPRGILLAGPPGTGKTLSAKVMGAAANLPVLMWSVGETHSKYVGESAEFTRDVLDAADAINNCILVVDEVDTQLSEGGEGDSKAHEEVLGMVLTWMQEKVSDVVVVITTNHPERLRHALLERCDRHWFVDYPGLAACKQVLEIHLRKRNLSDALTTGEVDLLASLAHSKSFAGRNIEFAIEKAHASAFMDDRVMGYDDLYAVIFSSKGLMEKRPEEAQAIRKWSPDECQPATTPDETSARPSASTDLAAMHDADLDI